MTINETEDLINKCVEESLKDEEVTTYSDLLYQILKQTRKKIPYETVIHSLSENGDPIKRLERDFLFDLRLHLIDLESKVYDLKAFITLLICSLSFILISLIDIGSDGLFPTILLDCTKILLVVANSTFIFFWIGFLFVSLFFFEEEDILDKITLSFGLSLALVIGISFIFMLGEIPLTQVNLWIGFSVLAIILAILNLLVKNFIPQQSISVEEELDFEVIKEEPEKGKEETISKVEESIEEENKKLESLGEYFQIIDNLIELAYVGCFSIIFIALLFFNPQFDTIGLGMLLLIGISAIVLSTKSIIALMYPQLSKQQQWLGSGIIAGVVTVFNPIALIILQILFPWIIIDVGAFSLVQITFLYELEVGKIYLSLE